MDNLLINTLLKIWQIIFTYINIFLNMIQKIYTESCQQLLIGIVIGFLLARMLYVVLIILGVIILGFFLKEIMSHDLVQSLLNF